MSSKDSLFAKNLKNLRIKSKLTQTELGKQLEISASTIGMYEQGRRKPDNETLLNLCSVFGVSTDYMLGLNHVAMNDEVDNIIEDFTQKLLSYDSLMFNGEPVTTEDKRKLVDAIKIAAAVAVKRQENNKNK